MWGLSSPKPKLDQEIRFLAFIKEFSQINGNQKTKIVKNHIKQADHPSKDPNFCILYLWSPFCHYPELLTIGEGRNVEEPVQMVHMVVVWTLAGDFMCWDCIFYLWGCGFHSGTVQAIQPFRTQSHSLKLDMLIPIPAIHKNGRVCPRSLVHFARLDQPNRLTKSNYTFQSNLEIRKYSSACCFSFFVGPYQHNIIY